MPDHGRRTPHPSITTESMQSRETRFVLRIESGERQGEEVPLEEGTLQVGRRSECGLVLKDGSVSGKHAEFRVAGGRIELVDLGSTNGTRVAGEKIERAAVSPGDAILFGNVRVTLKDTSVPGASGDSLLEPVLEGAPRASEPGPDTAGGLGHVSAEKVTRSKKGSKRPLVLLVVVVLLGGGSFAWFKFQRPGRVTRARVEVPSVPGNLLADGSFEEATGEWTTADTAPVAFAIERGFAHTGDLGLGAALRAGEDGQPGWSIARSGEIVLHARRSVVLAGSMRVEESAYGRAGLELSSSTQALPTCLAWLPARPATGSFEPFELAFDVPLGFDRARVVVAGMGPGAVALDDLSVLEQEARGGGARFTEYELTVLGTPGSSALLVRSGTPLLFGFDLSSWGRGRPEGWAQASLECEASASGFRLRFPGAPRDAGLRFLALRQEGGGGSVATTGEEGYASYGGDFSRAGVTNVLLGSGTELLRIGFEQPVQVEGTRIEGGMSFRIALGGQQGCDLQLSFSEERAQAATLADRARDAERAKDLGGALAAWTELLDHYPFEQQLVQQASESRARLIQAGLAEVDLLQRDMERARFFRLPELFRKGEERAQELVRQYRGSEVEAEAAKLVDLCQRAFTELTAGSRSGEAQRLKGVLEALDPAAAPKLTEHVREALESVDRGSEDH